MQATAARFFGAFRNAAQSLKEYYEVELPKLRALDPLARPNPMFPYKCSYTSPSGHQNLIQYSRQFRKGESNSLIFYAKSVGLGSEEVERNLCIKFFRHYSDEAH